MKKVKLLPREKLIITIAVLAVSVYVFYAYWFTPYSNNIAQAQAQVKTLKAQLNQQKALLAKEKEFAARQPETEDKLKTLSVQLPDADAVPSVMDDLRQLFENNGATVTSMTLQSEGKGKGPVKDVKTVQVAFNAPYAQAQKLVSAIESDTKRTYTVGDISLTPATGTITVYIHLDTTALPTN